jgi:hypothetical protein
MLRSLKELERYSLQASDGEIGSVVDFLWDDERWVVRYLVADTGGFLGGRLVLISPISFRELDWSSRRFHVALTKKKVENSPGIDTDKPVSRAHEQHYSRYYGFPPYWGYAGLWGMGVYPVALAGQPWNEPSAEPPEPLPEDVHLRSAREVRGYHIQGSDDSIGHVEDYVVDDETWAIRYLVIDTRNWWFGKKVLVAPEWATQISWADKKVYMDLSRRAIEQSPEWDPNAGVNREYETRLYDYYGRPAYWRATPSEVPTPPEPRDRDPRDAR